MPSQPYPPPHFLHVSPALSLQHATDDFKPSRKLGEGGFGTVFSGTLHHTPVAIKVLKNTDGIQAASEFQKEVRGKDGG